jgi:hypothetical protein
MRRRMVLTGCVLFLCGALASCDRIGSSYGSLTPGAICGSRTIVGRSVLPVEGPGGCGIERPVQITAVAGVALSTPATLNCPAARALEAWVETGAKPAVGRRGGGLESLTVAASYACRTRNHQRGGRLSEHSKGNAIDFSGFTLRDGTQVSLLQDWDTRQNGRVLREMWRSACGPFGVVLGPESDRFHRDHFHFDTSNKRNPYCR